MQHSHTQQGNMRTHLYRGPGRVLLQHQALRLVLHRLDGLLLLLQLPHQVLPTGGKTHTVNAPPADA